MEVLGEYTPSILRAFDEIDAKWKDYDALVIAGSHNPQNIEVMISKIKEAREIGKPFYGECLAYQLAFIEFCKNVIGIKDATSEEWGQGTFVVRRRKEGLNVGLKNGESYWNNFEIDKFLVEKWELPPNFFIAQYHASYQSSIRKPHKLITSFLKYAREYTRTVAM